VGLNREEAKIRIKRIRAEGKATGKEDSLEYAEATWRVGLGGAWVSRPCPEEMNRFKNDVDRCRMGSKRFILQQRQTVVNLRATSAKGGKKPFNVAGRSRGIR